MTVSTTSTRISYAGTGTTGPFDIPFKIFADGDVVVTKTVDSTGVSTALTLTTDYSITGEGGAGADLTTVAAVASGETLLIYLNLENTQPTDYVNNDGFDADVVEDSLDRVTLLTRQQTDNDFAIKVPSSDASAPAELPSATDRAGFTMVFDINGDPGIGVPAGSFASPGEIGGTTPAAGTFTTLSATTSVDLTTDDTPMQFGEHADVTLTHIHNNGIILNSTRKLYFEDVGNKDQYIGSGGSGITAIAAPTEIDLTAAAIDINGAVDISGDAKINGAFGVGSDTELTLSSDAITVTKSYHTVAGEGASADDLVTINGGVEGDIVILRPASGSVTITVKDTTGNLQIAGDFVMNSAQDTITLYKASISEWYELSRSNNGA